MNPLPASTGWSWIKRGFALFGKQPIELSTLFLAFMFLVLALGLLPAEIGNISLLLLTPVFTMGFMQACVEVERGKRAHPGLLLTGFRSPAFRTLLLLGVMYLLASLLASVVFAQIDDSVFRKVLERKIAVTSPEVQNSSFLYAMLASFLVYTPAAMAFWYAAPLIAWKRMKLGKAMFYSFFAVWRAHRIFLVYGLGWVGITFVFFFVLTVAAILTGGNQTLSVLITMPACVALFSIFFCTFYPSYTDIFGKPDGAADTPVADGLNR
ncbi:MAG: hypothetical protein JSS58_05035 [Proteobacteria bacterium]|nr:hypothetical protein [Pseudomonadota bacterium]